MKLPEVRERIRRIARQLDEPHKSELLALADQLRKRRPINRSRVTSTPMSAKIRQKIIKLHLADRRMPQHKIAAILNLNVGRVSETLRGIRE